MTEKLTAAQAQVKQRELEEANAKKLPNAGHARREQMKSQQDALQAEAERIAAQMQAGTVDPSRLAIANEIASRTQHMTVSDADPAFVYGWISKNRHGQHIQAMKGLGWMTVQGDDPEAVELKGTREGTSPGTTRELGDVILMKIPRERYLVLKALEVAQTQKLQKASTAGLLALGDKYRDKGFIVRPFRMEDPDGDLSGPQIKPRRFTSRQQAMKMLDKAMRDGSVPGMVIEQS